MIPYVTEEAVRRILTEKLAFQLARETFILMAKRKFQMPPKIYLRLPGKKNDFRAMPAFLEKRGHGISGIKWVSVFPDNPWKKLPTVFGTIILNSSQTGLPLAILEANTITAMRTAAASAVATCFLANPRSKLLAIVGAGVQAEFQLRALASIYRFETIRVWGEKTGEGRRFCQKHSSRFRALLASQTIEACVSLADVVVTCTPSRRPLIQEKWIKPGAHINAIGADAKGKQELHPKLLKSGKVIVDEWQQASHSGEINVPVSRGLFTRKNCHAELSEIVAGKKKGRANRSEITIFDSTGLATLDMYFAAAIFSRWTSVRAKRKLN